MHFFYTGSLFFPALFFLPVSTETKKSERGRKVIPCIEKMLMQLMLFGKQNHFKSSLVKSSLDAGMDVCTACLRSCFWDRFSAITF